MFGINIISSLLSNISLSSITAAVSSIGSALTSFVSSVAPVLAGVIEAIKPVAEALGKFANAFLQGLGILKPDETIENMGNRALQAADQGITIDKFDKFEDYMNALRKFELNPEISNKKSTTEKLVAGMGIGTIGVEDKFNVERGSLNGLWLLPMTNPNYFTPERMQTLVSTGRLSGDIYAYLEKRLDGADSKDFRKGLEVTAEGKPMNETELGKLYEALDSAQEKMDDIARQLQEKNTPAQGN